MSFREGASDQLYEIDLVETGNADPDRSHLVNVRFGRRGQILREGAKTPYAVSAQQAAKIFDSVVVSKMNEGYRRMDVGVDDVQPANVQPAAAEAAPVPAASGRDRALIEQLDACLRDPWPEQKRDRLVWRVGELRLAAAGPALIRLAQKLGPAEAGCSLVWALARCAGGEAVDILKAIAAQTQQPLVAGLAEFALISPLMGEQRQSVHAGASLPAGIAAALQRYDIDALSGAFADLAWREPSRVGPLMVAIYRLAQTDRRLGDLLVALIGRIPVRPPYLLGLRRIFKYAEMLDDAAAFGAVAHRFDTAAPMYRHVYQRDGGVPRTYVPGLPGWQALTHLRGAPDAKTGLSQQTLAYLKRRIWRALRKRGESGQTSFVELATGYLLAFTETDARKPRQEWSYRWQNGQMHSTARHYGPLAHAWTTGQLFYRNAPQVALKPGSLTYHSPGELTGQERGEAFPELWNARLDCALTLASDSRCEPVALFGLRFLRDNPGFRRGLDSTALERLLTSPFEPVMRLALEEVRDRLAEGQVSASLVAVLLDARLTEARELGIKRVELDASWPWADPRLGFIALTSAYEDVRQPAIRLWTKRGIGAEAGAALIGAVTDWLLSLPAALGEGEIARLDHLRACLAALWPQHDLPVAPETVARLMAHPASHVAAVGIDAFGLSGADAGALPEELLQRLLDAPQPEIQAAALGLLNRLNDEQLATRALLVLSLVTSESARIRQAVRPLVTRLAARFPRVAEDLSARLIDRLFQSAPDDAFAEDLVALLVEAAPGQLAALDAAMIWRLLQAKAKGAKLLGAAIVVNRDPSIFSVRQLARLGNHSHASVRQWVMTAYETNPQRFSGEPQEAVLLIESEWADAYEFALKYFERWPDAIWRPDVLGVVADSTNPKVLAFARSVLRRALAPGDASEQLSRLLEHPAASMHLLITEVLTAAAAADDAVFAKVLPLSRIVLLCVHQGRVAKDRITAFLRVEALKSAERAAAIAPIFTDLSLSIVERDRAAAVMALRDIGIAYPALAEGSPLKRVAVERRLAR